jgi:hypothetical protein
MINNLLTKNSRPNSNQELRKQFGFEAIVIFFAGGHRRIKWEKYC